MNIPFIDPFDCDHKVEATLSDKTTSYGELAERTVVYRCARCGATIEHRQSFSTPPTVH